MNKDTLRANAETVLAFYEKDIVEHVMSSQVPTKELKKLLLRSSKIKPTEGMSTSVSKSSLLGKDPFGQKEIPAELMEKGELTPAGSLLKSIQVSNFQYARVHLTRILGKDLEVKVRRLEMAKEGDDTTSSSS